MNWSDILASGGVPEPPGRAETLAVMLAPGYESEAARWRRERAEEQAAKAEAAKAARRKRR